MLLWDKQMNTNHGEGKMKLLTIIVSRDLDHEVEDIISGMNIGCYVKFSESYGISHSEKEIISEDLPWEAAVLIINGEEEDLERLAEKIQTHLKDKPFKPCLRMMLTPVDKVWM